MPQSDFQASFRNRGGETLFIDARKLGFMKDRVLRDFADIPRVAFKERRHSCRQPEKEGRQECRPSLRGYSRLLQIMGISASIDLKPADRKLHAMFRYVNIDEQAGTGIPKTLSGWESQHWLQDSAWNYMNGKVISPEGGAPEREDFRAVVLKGRLAEAWVG